MTDLGSPRLSAELAASVVIFVDDVNDSPPVFDHNSYTTDLVLPTYEDVVVISLRATDEDLDNIITYSFTSENDEEHFRIDPSSGVVRVSNVIGLNDDHEVHVRASDGVHATNVTVHIHSRLLITGAEDGGDEYLHFSRMSYIAHISENSNVGERDLLILQAVGQALEEPLYYQILNPCGMFEMGITSGKY